MSRANRHVVTFLSGLLGRHDPLMVRRAVANRFVTFLALLAGALATVSFAPACAAGFSARREAITQSVGQQWPQAGPYSALVVGATAAALLTISSGLLVGLSLLVNRPASDLSRALRAYRRNPANKRALKELTLYLRASYSAVWTGAVTECGAAWTATEIGNWLERDAARGDEQAIPPQWALLVNPENLEPLSRFTARYDRPPPENGGLLGFVTRLVCLISLLAVVTSAMSVVGSQDVRFVIGLRVIGSETPKNPEGDGQGGDPNRVKPTQAVPPRESWDSILSTSGKVNLQELERDEAVFDQLPDVKKLLDGARTIADPRTKDAITTFETVVGTVKQDPEVETRRQQALEAARKLSEDIRGGKLSGEEANAKLAEAAAQVDKVDELRAQIREAQQKAAEAKEVAARAEDEKKKAEQEAMAAQNHSRDAEAARDQAQAAGDAEKAAEHEAARQSAEQQKAEAEARAREAEATAAGKRAEAEMNQEDAGRFSREATKLSTDAALTIAVLAGHPEVAAVKVLEAIGKLFGRGRGKGDGDGGSDGDGPKGKGGSGSGGGTGEGRGGDVGSGNSPNNSGPSPPPGGGGSPGQGGGTGGNPSGATPNPMANSGGQGGKPPAGGGVADKGGGKGDGGSATPGGKPSPPDRPGGDGKSREPKIGGLGGKGGGPVTGEFREDGRVAVKVGFSQPTVIAIVEAEELEASAVTRAVSGGLMYADRNGKLKIADGKGDTSDVGLTVKDLGDLRGGGLSLAQETVLALAGRESRPTLLWHKAIGGKDGWVLFDKSKRSLNWVFDEGDKTRHLERGLSQDSIEAPPTSVPDGWESFFRELLPLTSRLEQDRIRLDRQLPLLRMKANGDVRAVVAPFAEAGRKEPLALHVFDFTADAKGADKLAPRGTLTQRGYSSLVGDQDSLSARGEEVLFGRYLDKLAGTPDKSAGWVEAGWELRAINLNQQDKASAVLTRQRGGDTLVRYLPLQDTGPTGAKPKSFEAKLTDIEANYASQLKQSLYKTKGMPPELGHILDSAFDQWVGHDLSDNGKRPNRFPVWAKDLEEVPPLFNSR